MKNSNVVPLTAACSLLAAHAVLANPALPPGQIHAADGDPGIPWAAAGLAPTAQTQSFFVRIGIYGYENQWAFERLGLEDAHQHATGAGMTVAVLDTGVWADHELLDGHVASGYNFTDDAGDPSDTSDAADGVDNDGDGAIDEFSGHGTYVAGIILATAPDAVILPVTVLDSDGVGTESSIAAGIYYAIAEGANIINLSVATTVDSGEISQAIEEATNAGVLVVASVANTNTQQPVSYPAAYPEVLAVAATDQDDLKSNFSDYGSYVDVSAPGTDVVGPIPNHEYGLASGASAAAAFVSGAAAVMLENATTNDPRAFVDEVLAATSDDLDAANPTYAGLLGVGRLDVAAAATIASGGSLTSAHAMSVRTVSTNDVILYLDKWFVADASAELTGDAVVDEIDLVVFLDQWFNSAP